MKPVFMGLGIGDFVRVFVDHPCPHSLQHGQGIGQGDLAGTVDFQTHFAPASIKGTIKLDDHRFRWRELRKHQHIVRCKGTRKIFLISRREPVGKTLRQRQPLALTMHLQQGGTALVLPALSQTGNSRLQCGQIRRHGRRRACPHQVMHTRHRVVCQHGSEFNRLAVQSSHQFIPHARAKLRVVPVTRDKYQHRCESAKRVTSGKQTAALTFLQAQDTQGVGVQSVGINLKQLIPGVSIQDRLQGFGSMTVWHHGSAMHHLGAAFADQGNFGHRCRVSLGGVKPQKSRLPHHLAGAVKAFDSNAVKPGGPMHSRTSHGFGDQHHLIRFEVDLSLWRQHVDRAAWLAAQDAQPGVG